MGTIGGTVLLAAVFAVSFARARSNFTRQIGDVSPVCNTMHNPKLQCVVVDLVVRPLRRSFLRLFSIRPISNRNLADTGELFCHAQHDLADGQAMATKALALATLLSISGTGLLVTGVRHALDVHSVRSLIRL